MLYYVQVHKIKIPEYRSDDIMNQTIQIDLASPITTSYEHFPEIKKAIENASLGL